jgi:CheY-like chemotaxis protein
VGDLLDVARFRQRKVELKQEVFEIGDVLMRAIEISAPLVEQRRHHLHVDIPREGLPVRADLVRLSQVFGNLVNNAAKYTPPGGQIHVEAAQQGDEVVVRVRDNGVGIDPDQLDKIFDLFVQAGEPESHTQGGLGIGLSLVRSLLDRMGGTVTARSEGLGRGSEFIVCLPRSDASVRRPTGQTGKLEPVGGGGQRRILVVDDNVDAADLLAELLRMLGHEVMVAHDGPGALALLGRMTPNIAILDIGLPGMSGHELAKRMRDQLGAAVRLIALSGYGQTSDRERSEAAGFDQHLVKPIDVAQVTRLLESPSEEI